MTWITPWATNMMPAFSTSMPISGVKTQLKCRRTLRSFRGPWGKGVSSEQTLGCKAIVNSILINGGERERLKSISMATANGPPWLGPVRKITGGLGGPFAVAIEIDFNL